jgi:hypothetical protein
MITNNIPILEYDSTSPEVIAPNHDAADLNLPEKCLFAFLGDVVHQYAKERQARGARFGQFLFTADSLANVHDYDERGFGHDSHEKALLLGLEILREC